MAFSYLAKQSMDDLDLETFTIGDSIHIRKKSTQETFDPKEEKRLFMELYEKHGVEIRAQWQNGGYWGTGMRNDDGQHNMNLPQGVGYYEYNKMNGLEASVDTWPRMYTEAWLNGD